MLAIYDEFNANAEDLVFSRIHKMDIYNAFPRINPTFCSTQFLQNKVKVTVSCCCLLTELVTPKYDSHALPNTFHPRLPPRPPPPPTFPPPPPPPSQKLVFTSCREHAKAAVNSSESRHTIFIPRVSRRLRHRGRPRRHLRCLHREERRCHHRRTCPVGFASDTSAATNESPASSVITTEQDTPR